jgi:hypothetical protein
MHPIMPRWGIRRMSDLTVEELAQVQQKLDGWIRQQAHDPERPQRRPWVRHPPRGHLTDRKESP